MFRAEYILEKKSVLFGAIFAVIVGSLAMPVIVPHIFHGYHVFHILMHVAGITLSSFLTVIAIVAYSRLKTRRMLLTMIAFTVFGVSESIVLVDATWPALYDISLLPLLELGHMLMITSMGLLAMGAFRND